MDDEDAVRAAVVDAVCALPATLLNLHVHSFSPQGVTAVATLAESHLSVHTWPECGYVAADVFTCGDAADPQAAVDVLKTAFAADVVEVKSVERGRRPAMHRQETMNGRRGCTSAVFPDGIERSARTAR